MSPSPETIIASNSIFSSFSREDLKTIVSLSEIINLQDGQTVFERGNPSNSLYIVISGEVVIRISDGDRQTDIARYLEGNSFGELDLFTGEPRSADAFAQGSTILLEFPRNSESLFNLEQKWPKLSAQVFCAFLIHISARIRSANDLVKTNSPLVRKLKKPADIDKLTGLYNKLFFEEILENTMKNNDNTGLLMCKPDNFKAINDAYGHEAGDEVLKLIAKSLKESVSDSEMLFRYMGNENALILPKTTRDEMRNTAVIVGNLYRELDLSGILKGDNFTLSVSIGLSISPDHGSDPVSLIDAAHPLTLEGRQRGGNMILFPEDS